MKPLVVTEMKRCLSRRLVRTLIVLALLGIVVAGVITYRAAVVGPTTFRLTDLWPDTAGDGFLLPAAVLLVLTAFVAGTSMVGADWRSGALSLQLTWEPRRARVLVARAAAAMLVAAAIAVVLQLLLVFALLPTALLQGTTEGADLVWWQRLFGGVLRTAVMTGLAATMGIGLATVGRNTAAAVGALFVHLNVVEPLIRALRPSWGRWLIGENTAVFVSGQALVDSPVSPSTLAALVVLTAITAASVAFALVLLRGRDVL